MRHLRLEAMFHLLWAIWHACPPQDESICERLFKTNRNNLHSLPDIFTKFIEDLDPSEFWYSPAAKIIKNRREKNEFTKVCDLQEWDAHLDEYFNRYGV